MSIPKKMTSLAAVSIAFLVLAQVFDAGVLAALPQAAAAGGAESAATNPSLIDYIAQGGTIGYIIILLSLVAVTLVISQLIALQSSRLAPPTMVADLRQILAAKDVNRAILYCHEADPANVLTRTLGGALVRCRRSSFGSLELPAAVEEIGRQEVARLSRVTDVIELLAQIAPMLGLLGTVVGMVGAFDVIANTEGPVRPDDLAGNISQALITTVLGLIVAIPTTAMHTYLRSRIEQLAADLGNTIEELAAMLLGDQGTASPAVAQVAPQQPHQQPHQQHPQLRPQPPVSQPLSQPIAQPGPRPVPPQGIPQPSPAVPSARAANGPRQMPSS